MRQNREAGARIHISEGMDRDVTVMDIYISSPGKRKNRSDLDIFFTGIP